MLPEVSLTNMNTQKCFWYLSNAQETFLIFFSHVLSNQVSTLLRKSSTGTLLKVIWGRVMSLSETFLKKMYWFLWENISWFVCVCAYDNELRIRVILLVLFTWFRHWAGKLVSTLNRIYFMKESNFSQITVIDKRFLKWRMESNTKSNILWS